jgi:hypothetical protein
MGWCSSKRRKKRTVPVLTTSVHQDTGALATAISEVNVINHVGKEEDVKLSVFTYNLIYFYFFIFWDIIHIHLGIFVLLLFELKASYLIAMFLLQEPNCSCFSLCNFRQRFIFLFRLAWTLKFLLIPLCQLVFQACTTTPGILVELDGFQSALFPISPSWIAEIIDVPPHTCPNFVYLCGGMSPLFKKNSSYYNKYWIPSNFNNF